MRSRFRLVLAALVAGGLVVGPPAAQAKSGSSKRSTSTGAPKVPALTADVARFEPLGLSGAAPAETVNLEGVGEYRGVVEVRRVGAGLGAVNEVALDDYLKGISEVPSGWPPEVLRAQAIAARTYLLWVLGNAPSGQAAALGAQICATESCQVYSGVAKERAPNGERWAAAVRDTAGQAVLSGGAPILAKYSAGNGGRSVSGGKPYLKAVDDPDDARCPLHRWGLTVSYDDLGRALGVPGTVTAVRATPGDVVVDWTADGGGGQLTVPRTQFRAKVGASVPPPPDRSRTVPSILFSLRPDDAARVAALDGRGYGHGIGLSQWGAYGKALRGMKAPAILAAYYGGLQPSTVPAAKLPARVRVAVDGGKPSAPTGAPRADQPGARPATAGRREAVVSVSGPFRVLDSKGEVVVPVATGAWKVVAAGKGVRLVPPRDQARPAGLSVLGIEPAAPLPGQPLTVRYRSHLPALVSATAQAPGASAAPVLGPEVAGTEERRLTLPPATRPGPYPVTLTADSGPGRTATVTVTPEVADPAAPAAPPEGPSGGLLGDPGLVPYDLLVLPDLLGRLGLLDVLPEIPAALHQTLLAGGGETASAAERLPDLERASRSSSTRAGPLAAPAGSGAGADILGMLLAALAGLAVWRFRARRA